ncbi:MAG: A/G-specific adenine glycosylase [Thalassovita sp.]
MRDEGYRTARVQELLAWYDANARVLPWRISPADQARQVRADPYRIWMSEVMLQQTTVAAVKSYFLRFTELWPSVADLAAAPDAVVMAEWAGLGYYARARNLLKCARTVVAEHDGRFPETREGLLKLPGIGPYTAAAISSIAYDLPETVVDGNVERVMARLFDVHLPLPGAKPVLTEHAATLTPNKRSGDYAQAVMDLGATVCTPRSPNCAICPWQTPCAAHAAGTAAELPKKTPKKPKPTRRGIAYVARTPDGSWLLERRPDRGLLGGMLGWPGSEWVEEAPTPAAPYEADWHQLDKVARHTFTHFHLELTVCVAELSEVPEAGDPHLIPASEFKRSDLPTVMRKVFDLALMAFADSITNSK